MVEKLPRGWVRTTLGEVCALNPGIPFSESLPDSTEVSFVPMASVEEGSGRLDASQIRMLGSVRRGYTPFKENDVVFAKITPCMENGKIALAMGLKNGLGYGSTELFVFRPYTGLLPRFALYFLLQPSLRKAAEHQMSGASGQKRVPGKYLSNYRFLLPPAGEQRRIVAKLDAALAAVARAEAAANRALKRLNSYRAAVLHSAVVGELTREWSNAQLTEAPEQAAPGLLRQLLSIRRMRWEETQVTRSRRLGELPKGNEWKSRYPEPREPCDKGLFQLPVRWTWASIEQVSARVTVGFVGAMKDEYVTRGIPFLRSQNVRSNRFEPEGLVFIRRQFHDKLSKSKIFPGDVVVVRSGVSVGTTCVIPDTLKEANCSDLVIIQGPLIEPSFISYYMNSAARQYVEGGKVGVAQPHFNTASVASLPIPLPPTSEQAEIVREVHRRLAAADRLEVTLNQQLHRAEVARQSLLDEAFSGNLVPQDPTDEPASLLLDRIRAMREAEAQRPKGSRMSKQKASSRSVKRRSLLTVLEEQKGQALTPEQLFLAAGFEPPQVDEFYRELALIRAKITEQKPKGSEAKSWPLKAHVLLQLKK